MSMAAFNPLGPLKGKNIADRKIRMKPTLGCRTRTSKTALPTNKAMTKMKMVEEPQKEITVLASITAMMTQSWSHFLLKVIVRVSERNLNRKV
jgi:hypothetical protein